MGYQLFADVHKEDAYQLFADVHKKDARLKWVINCLLMSIKRTLGLSGLSTVC